MQDQPTETELKIPVADLGPVRERLEAAGARCKHPPERETNTIFDSDDRKLSRESGVLRLRRIGAVNLLTLKGPPSYRGNVKIRAEHEVEISDLKIMRSILSLLGFGAVARYEKDRESWRFRDLSVELDHTPMGDFVEIEGPAEAIETAAGEIGLDPGRAVRGSYLSLWQEYRLSHPNRDLPADMVFDR